MNKSRLIAKSLLLISLFLLPLFTVFTIFTVIQRKTSAARGMEREIDSISQLLPAALIQPMMNHALAQVRFIIWNTVENDTIIGIRVYDNTRLIGELIEEGVEETEVVYRKLPIIFDDKINESIPLGEVEILFSNSVMSREITKEAWTSIIQSVSILSAVMLFLFALLSNVVVKPVKIASAKMEEISKGEADLRSRLVISSGDEIGQLSQHFNTFIEHLDSLVGKIRLSLEQTIQAQTSLSTNTEESSTAVAQMVLNIETAKKQMEMMNKKVSQSADTIGNIVQYIQQTIENADTQNKSVIQTVEAVTKLLSSIDIVSSVTEEQKTAVENLVRSARTGGQKISQTGAMVEEINNSIEEIEQLLTLINNISSQTNLLAMNAAIEAAHAGEAGKGFAVVADEIRKLAESSSRNSKSIAGVLKNIITKIETTSSFSKETTFAFEEIQKEVSSVSFSLDDILDKMKEMNIASRNINSTMETLKKVSSSLENSTKKMDANSRDLSSSMEIMFDISSKVGLAMEQIHGGTQEINTAMVQVSEINNRLGDSAGELRDRISLFRTSD